MELKLRKAGKIYVIDVIGEMDLYNAFRLKDLVKKMIASGVSSYVLNLDQVPYMDSSGIGSLLYVNTELKKRGLPLRISGVKGSVRKVIELTRLVEHFPIVQDLDTALQQLRDKAREKAEGQPPG